MSTPSPDRAWDMTIERIAAGRGWLHPATRDRVEALLDEIDREGEDLPVGIVYMAQAVREDFA
jgi:hypothetical protein